jgi:hypothetical protein
MIPDSIRVPATQASIAAAIIHDFFSSAKRRTAMPAWN